MWDFQLTCLRLGENHIKCMWYFERLRMRVAWCGLFNRQTKLRCWMRLSNTWSNCKHICKWWIGWKCTRRWCCQLPCNSNNLRCPWWWLKWALEWEWTRTWLWIWIWIWIWTTWTFPPLLPCSIFLPLCLWLHVVIDY